VRQHFKSLWDTVNNSYALGQRKLKDSNKMSCLGLRDGHIRRLKTRHERNIAA